MGIQRTSKVAFPLGPPYTPGQLRRFNHAQGDTTMFLREPSHILILLLVLVVLFGAKRLPDSAKSLAKSMRIFKSEMKEIGNDEKKTDGPDSGASAEK